MNSFTTNFCFFLVLSGFLACGGKAIIDPVDTGGAGANSGTGGSSSQSSSSSPTGSGGQGADATVSTVSTSVTASSSSGGDLMCDNSGQCDVCFECSITGPCAEAWNACLQNPACVAMGDCMENCQNPSCFGQCAQENPGGGEDFFRAMACTLCDACENDCDQPPMLCN